MREQVSAWDTLPTGFLKKTFSGWLRLDYEARLLVVELAKQQHFKCALCSTDRNLEIDHDPDPFRGIGTRLTVDNIRGILCGWCNKQLSLHEREQRGEFSGLDNVYCLLDDRRAELYLEAYDRRIIQLEENRLEKSCPNYWVRWRLLDKFDDWKVGWTRTYPWEWYFEEIKERRHGKVRTAKQAVRALAACMKFVKEQREKDPDYEIPESFIQVLKLVKPIFDKLRPRIEAARKQAAALSRS